MVRRGRLAALAITSALVPFLGAGAQASGGGGGGAGAEGLHLVPMEEITVPVVEFDRVTGALRFKLVLEAANAEAAAKVTTELPALRAATVAAALEFARLNVSGLRAVDVAQMDHDLTAAIHASAPGVSRVLIVEVGANRG
ncbi:hypothetical protein TS85_11130 [Sphingomonas hengshuiensis]|uniref:Uncharacterized protein n=1 Tax=Sphingomonas hengshuiensis TaxID=1609977 RepID=A0A7U4LFJ6_9SPHN|nr:hypothetical protein TS85_11130 [Sphingomonas hengshuiensis]